MEAKQQDIIRARKFRMAKYLLEDFLSGKNEIRKMGFFLIALGILYVFSTLVFSASNYPFAFLTIGCGFVLLYWNAVSDWKKGIELETGMSIFFLLPVLEFLFIGSPEKLIPGLGEYRNIRFINIFTLLNDISPFVYAVLKVFIIYPFVRMLFLKKKINGLSPEFKTAIGWKS